MRPTPFFCVWVMTIMFAIVVNAAGVCNTDLILNSYTQCANGASCAPNPVSPTNAVPSICKCSTGTFGVLCGFSYKSASITTTEVSPIPDSTTFSISVTQVQPDPSKSQCSIRLVRLLPDGSLPTSADISSSTILVGYCKDLGTSVTDQGITTWTITSPTFESIARDEGITFFPTGRYQVLITTAIYDLTASDYATGVIGQFDWLENRYLVPNTGFNISPLQCDTMGTLRTDVGDCVCNTAKGYYGIDCSKRYTVDLPLLLKQSNYDNQGQDQLIFFSPTTIPNSISTYPQQSGYQVVWIPSTLSVANDGSILSTQASALVSPVTSANTLCPSTTLYDEPYMSYRLGLRRVVYNSVAAYEPVSSTRVDEFGLKTLLQQIYAVSAPIRVKCYSNPQIIKYIRENLHNLKFAVSDQAVVDQGLYIPGVATTSNVSVYSAATIAQAPPPTCASGFVGPRCDIKVRYTDMLSAQNNYISPGQRLTVIFDVMPVNDATFIPTIGSLTVLNMPGATSQSVASQPVITGTGARGYAYIPLVYDAAPAMPADGITYSATVVIDSKSYAFPLTIRSVMGPVGYIQQLVKDNNSIYTAHAGYRACMSASDVSFDNWYNYANQATLANAQMCTCQTTFYGPFCTHSFSFQSSLTQYDITTQGVVINAYPEELIDPTNTANLCKIHSSVTQINGYQVTPPLVLRAPIDCFTYSLVTDIVPPVVSRISIPAVPDQLFANNDLSQYGAPAGLTSANSYQVTYTPMFGSIATLPYSSVFTDMASPAGSACYELGTYATKNGVCFCKLGFLGTTCAVQFQISSPTIESKFFVQLTSSSSHFAEISQVLQSFSYNGATFSYLFPQPVQDLNLNWYSNASIEMSKSDRGAYFMDNSRSLLVPIFFNSANSLYIPGSLVRPHKQCANSGEYVYNFATGTYSCICSPGIENGISFGSYCQYFSYGPNSVFYGQDTFVMRVAYDTHFVNDIQSNPQASFNVYIAASDELPEFLYPLSISYVGTNTLVSGGSFVTLALTGYKFPKKSDLEVISPQFHLTTLDGKLQKSYPLTAMTEDEMMSVFQCAVSNESDIFSENEANIVDVISYLKQLDLLQWSPIDDTDNILSIVQGHCKCLPGRFGPNCLSKIILEDQNAALRSNQLNLRPGVTIGYTLTSIDPSYLPLSATRPTKCQIYLEQDNFGDDVNRYLIGDCTTSSLGMKYLHIPSDAVPASDAGFNMILAIEGKQFIVAQKLRIYPLTQSDVDLVDQSQCSRDDTNYATYLHNSILCLCKQESDFGSLCTYHVRRTSVITNIELQSSVDAVRQNFIYYGDSSPSFSIYESSDSTTPMSVQIHSCTAGISLDSCSISSLSTTYNPTSIGPTIINQGTPFSLFLSSSYLPIPIQVITPHDFMAKVIDKFNSMTPASTLQMCYKHGTESYNMDKFLANPFDLGYCNCRAGYAGNFCQFNMNSVSIQKVVAFIPSITLTLPIDSTIGVLLTTITATHTSVNGSTLNINIVASDNNQLTLTVVNPFVGNDVAMITPIILTIDGSSTRVAELVPWSLAPSYIGQSTCQSAVQYHSIYPDIDVCAIDGCVNASFNFNNGSPKISCTCKTGFTQGGLCDVCDVKLPTNYVGEAVGCLGVEFALSTSSSLSTTLNSVNIPTTALTKSYSVHDAPLYVDANYISIILSHSQFTPKSLLFTQVDNTSVTFNKTITITSTPTFDIQNIPAGRYNIKLATWTNTANGQYLVWDLGLATINDCQALKLFGLCTGTDITGCSISAFIAATTASSSASTEILQPWCTCPVSMMGANCEANFSPITTVFRWGSTTPLFSQNTISSFTSTNAQISIRDANNKVIKDFVNGDYSLASIPTIASDPTNALPLKLVPTYSVSSNNVPSSLSQLFPHQLSFAPAGAGQPVTIGQQSATTITNINYHAATGSLLVSLFPPSTPPTNTDSDYQRFTVFVTPMIQGKDKNYLFAQSISDLTPLPMTNGLHTISGATFIPASYLSNSQPTTLAIQLPPHSEFLANQYVIRVISSSTEDIGDIMVIRVDVASSCQTTLALAAATSSGQQCNPQNPVPYQKSSVCPITCPKLMVPDTACTTCICNTLKCEALTRGGMIYLSAQQTNIESIFTTILPWILTHKLKLNRFAQTIVGPLDTTQIGLESIVMLPMNIRVNDFHVLQFFITIDPFNADTTVGTIDTRFNTIFSQYQNVLSFSGILYPQITSGTPFAYPSITSVAYNSNDMIPSTGSTTLPAAFVRFPMNALSTMSTQCAATGLAHGNCPKVTQPLSLYWNADLCQSDGSGSKTLVASCVDLFKNYIDYNDGITSWCGPGYVGFPVKMSIPCSYKSTSTANVNPVITSVVTTNGAIQEGTGRLVLGLSQRVTVSWTVEAAAETATVSLFLINALRTSQKPTAMSYNIYLGSTAATANSLTIVIPAQLQINEQDVKFLLQYNPDVTKKSLYSGTVGMVLSQVDLCGDVTCSDNTACEKTTGLCTNCQPFFIPDPNIPSKCILSCTNKCNLGKCTPNIDSTLAPFCDCSETGGFSGTYCDSSAGCNKNSFDSRTKCGENGQLVPSPEDPNICQDKCSCDENWDVNTTTGKCDVCLLRDSCHVLGTDSSSFTKCQKCICKHGYFGKTCSRRSFYGSIKFTGRPTSAAQQYNTPSTASTFSILSQDTYTELLATPAATTVTLSDDGKAILERDLAISMDLEEDQIQLLRLTSAATNRTLQTFNTTATQQITDVVALFHIISSTLTESVVPNNSSSMLISDTTTTTTTNDNSAPIGSLYDQWLAMQNSANSQSGKSAIENTQASLEIGNVSGIDNSYDPNCSGSSSLTCPTGSDPFSSYYDDDTPNHSSRAAITVVVVPIVIVVAFFIVLVLAVVQCRKREKFCFEPPKSQGNDHAHLGLGDDVSVASSPGTSRVQLASITTTSTKTSTKLTRSHKESVTTELEEVKCPTELPAGWKMMQHQVTTEIFYVNDALMLSQRHKPGESDDTADMGW